MKRRNTSPYASLGTRTWTSLIDTCFLAAWFFSVALIEPWSESTPGVIRALIWYAPLPLIEPLSIRIFSRTIGQYMLGFRVISLNDRPLTLPRLLLRQALKYSLLGISLLYIPFSSRRLSVHDQFTRAAVVRSESLLGTEGFGGEGLPPFRLRTFIVSLFWAFLSSAFGGVLASVLVLLALGVVAPELLEGRFTANIVAWVASLTSMWVFWVVLFRGAAGRLPGTLPAGET